MVSKEILVQYGDLQEEVKEVRERISQTEKQIMKIEEEGNVIDTVRFQRIYADGDEIKEIN